MTEPKMPSEAEVAEARDQLMATCLRIRQTEGPLCMRYACMAAMFSALCWALGDEDDNPLAEVLRGGAFRLVYPDRDEESPRRD